MDLLKRLVRKVRGDFASEVFERFPETFLKGQTDNKASQLALQQSYRLLASSNPSQLPSFNDVGFRQYSQFEEDGLILYIFSLIKPTSRKCLEICAGAGLECNTTNLLVNHGWWGSLFDGDANNVRRGNAFFANNRDTLLHPPCFTQAWITAENVNDLVRKSGLAGEIDLLSLDLDGVDYWVWKALEVVDPKVVVCETHNIVPPSLSITVPYRSDFAVKTLQDDFRGASLGAMTKLAHSKGYRLIGTHKYGFNAFFVKRGVGEEFFPEVSVESCLKDPYTLMASERRWPVVKSKDWISV